MAQFLTTNGVSHRLESIIDHAKDFLYLISPYLQINDQLRLRIDDSTRECRNTHIVYGKKKEGCTKDIEWMKSTGNIKVHFFENLHAKCYMNENEAIITSMNLFMYSQQTNNEMGVYVTLKDDPDLFRDLLSEAERIIRKSEIVIDIKPISVKPIYTKSTPKTVYHESYVETKNQHYGYCIRTGRQMTFNAKGPMCFKAFSTWAQFADQHYPEHYCHFSGEASNGETSFAHPILRKNWKAAQRMFDL